MPRLDYHHIPKVLDLIAALAPESLLEVTDGAPIYVPLCRAFLPTIHRLDHATITEALAKRTRVDVIMVPLRNLDQIRALLAKHQSLLIIAEKDAFEKADIAGLGPALFVNDPTGIIAYLGTSADIKLLRKNLLRRRVRRQSSFTPTMEAVYRTVRKVRGK